eukprot:1568602-Prymnesium_polylepis.1
MSISAGAAPRAKGRAAERELEPPPQVRRQRLPRPPHAAAAALARVVGRVVPVVAPKRVAVAAGVGHRFAVEGGARIGGAAQRGRPGVACLRAGGAQGGA